MLRLVILLCCLQTIISVKLTFDNSPNGVWSDYKTRYAKQYTTHTKERQRRTAFEQNVAMIHAHNMEADLGLQSYRMGLNQFTDLTTDEYRNKLFGGSIPDVQNHVENGVHNHVKNANSPVAYDTTALPPSVDWRKKGYVTPVMDQGKCNCSWAISPLGAVEGQHKAVTGKLVALSVQNIIDCAAVRNPCSGSIDEMIEAYIYMKNNGVDTEACYPYTGIQDICKYNKSCVGAKMTYWAHLPFGNEEALQNATANIGPISVFIDASHPSFQHYKSGVYDEPACSPVIVSHGMLVVEYGSQDNKDYWIVKNSWDTDWGEKGYILMSRNKGNQCAIASVPSYPTGVAV